MGAKATDIADWAVRPQGLVTLVAEADGPLGLMSLRPDGYLDLAFVHPDQRGKGVADGLHHAILLEAQALGLNHLTTQASRMARSFFLRQGWQEGAA